MSRTLAPPLDLNSDQAHSGRWLEAPATCRECGYELTGLPAGGRCPECGHAARRPQAAPDPDLGRARSVTVGLALLLGVTLYATCSVLVQPFSDDLGGTLPALNVPGPKLWATPLLQRPIGRGPQWPGVVGTRTALLSLLAVWLVTAPGRDEARGSGSWVRPAARWGAVIPFGAAFGVLLTSQGLWPSDLPSYRLVLVSFVELPAAALLYAHLCDLAALVPGRERRRRFEQLRWALPGTILAGALMMGGGWLLSRAQPTSPRGVDVLGPRTLVFAAYGAAALSCGMVATAAVGSLAAAYASAAFPAPRRAACTAVGLWRRALDRGRARRSSIRDVAVTSGLALLLAATLVGNDQALWTATRESPSGNLPFYGFPGPKLWAASPDLGRRSSWDPLVSRMTLVTMNIAAVWLITVPRPGRGRDRLRQLTRWLPVLTAGAALAAAAAWEGLEGTGRLTRGGIRPEFFSLTTVLCEVPPTVLLYLYLVRLATETGAAPLASRFKTLALAVPVLVGASFLLFVAFREVRLPLSAPALLAFCGVFGATHLAVATWAVALVTALALKFSRRLLPHASQQPMLPILREVGCDGGTLLVP